MTDYLDGDVYFKVACPDHNLVRARTQLKLLQDMDAHWDEDGFRDRRTGQPQERRRVTGDPASAAALERTKP